MSKQIEIGLRILSIGFIFFLINGSRSISAAPFKVVIDPGHGGADHGTVHLENTYPIAEKELTLGLALELEIELERAGISTTLTRRSDIDLPLPTRTQIANQQKADLFLSIHLNSTKDHSSNSAGIETYILNYTSDASSKRLAQLENKGLLPPNEIHHSADAAQNPDVALILKDLQLDSQIIKSRRLACYIQNALTHGLPSHKNRGVKEGLFYVLLGANMPAALVEVGFLSHPQERGYLLSYRGRQNTAKRIAKAIIQYKELATSRALPVDRAQRKLDVNGNTIASHQASHQASPQNCKFSHF